MGSEPSFDPTLFTKPVSEAKFKQLNSEESGAPLFNRAVQGLYPTGSTFKPITALAALGRHDITPSFSVNDTGCIHIGAQERCNAGKTAYGTVDLRNAIRVSSDVYFYTLGVMTNSAKTEVIQDMARGLGLGRRTGIDLPGEFPATSRTGAGASGSPRPRPPAGARSTSRSASSTASTPPPPRAAASPTCASGRSATTSASPSARATCRPRRCRWPSPTRRSPPAAACRARTSASRSRTTTAGSSSASSRSPRGASNLDPAGRQAVLDGLHAAASEPGGTSTQVWAGWDQNRFRSSARPAPPRPSITACPTTSRGTSVGSRTPRAPAIRASSSPSPSRGRLRRAGRRARRAADRLEVVSARRRSSSWGRTAPDEHRADRRSRPSGARGHAAPPGRCRSTACCCSRCSASAARRC